MAHNHGTGYKGFRSWAVQACSTFKPGESLPSRNEKFKFVGHGVVYDQGAPTQTGAYDTVNRLKQTEQKQKDYRIPDRRGVQAGADQRDSARRPKPFIATTTASNSYSNFIEEMLNINSKSVEDYRAAFDEVDSDRSGFIELGEVRALLRKVYGKEPPPREVDKFIKFFDRNQDGRVSWEEFTSGFEAVKELMAHESSTGSGRMAQPGWMKSQQIPRKLLQPAAIKSSYQSDMGVAGGDPMRRSFMAKTGMATTTGDLNLGTTKDTYQIPGYAGYIPNAKTNPGACEQGDGCRTRTKGEDLRLFTSHNLPGYTGHAPVDCKNDYGARLSGTDGRTSSGAAALGL